MRRFRPARKRLVRSLLTKETPKANQIYTNRLYAETYCLKYAFSAQRSPEGALKLTPVKLEVAANTVGCSPTSSATLPTYKLLGLCHSMRPADKLLTAKPLVGGAPTDVT